MYHQESDRKQRKGPQAELRYIISDIDKSGFGVAVRTNLDWRKVLEKIGEKK